MANKQRGKHFFTELSGLADGIGHLVKSTKRVAGGNAHDPDKIAKAQDKRERRAQAALRNAGIKKD